MRGKEVSLKGNFRLFWASEERKGFFERRGFLKREVSFEGRRGFVEGEFLISLGERGKKVKAIFEGRKFFSEKRSFFFEKAKFTRIFFFVV